MKSVCSGLISIVLMMAVMGGGLLHAIVPHSHGDAHQHSHDQESVMWTDLHSALRHEDKKILLAVAVLIIVFTYAISHFSIFTMAVGHMRRVLGHIKSLDPSAGELLRRGIHPYRAFG